MATRLERFNIPALLEASGVRILVYDRRVKACRSKSRALARMPRAVSTFEGESLRIVRPMLFDGELTSSTSGAIALSPSSP
jgi:hypothetical protein